MPHFHDLSPEEIRLLELRPKTIVFSAKAQLFLETLGLNSFLQDAVTQKKLYDEVKRHGLNRVSTFDLQRRNVKAENALTIAMRRTLWGDRIAD